MPIVDQFTEACKQAVFGASNLHQQCAIGLRDPQREVSVWLNGPGICLDVTDRNVMAAAQPLTLGVGLEGGCDAAAVRRGCPSLEFRERGGKQRLLGKINLRWADEIPLGEGQLYLFRARGCRNYCLSRARVWAHYTYYAYRQWRARARAAASTFRMVASELRSVFVFYICPRPVVLVSVSDGNLANIFPMDLIGPIGTRHFALALHSTSTAVPLMERSLRIALSSIPVEQTATAYKLGENHKRPSVNWAHVPFATSSSAAFGIPVPRFSLRVREMQIEAVRDLGSHKLFLANTVEDTRWAEGLQMFLVHGIYQARRHHSLQEVTP
jgi:flavin reductase (DIM6/NTAB) family NADH-FMN oxidoreductase RutF